MDTLMVDKETKDKAGYQICVTWELNWQFAGPQDTWGQGMAVRTMGLILSHKKLVTLQSTVSSLQSNVLYILKKKIYVLVQLQPEGF